MDTATSQSALLEAAASEIDRMAAEIALLSKAADEPIAIVGIGLRLGGQIETYADFVDALHSRISISPSSVSYRWGGSPGKADWPVIAVDGVERFDADHFGFSGSEAAAMDPQQRLLLTCAAEALEDAGIIADLTHGLEGGIFVGQCFDDHAMEVARRTGVESLDTYSVVGAARNLATARLARAFGLEGPAVSIDGSCASSLMAAHLAMQSLRARECDFALIAGVNLVLSPVSSEGFSKLGVLSQGGQCRPFSPDADGYVRGEGVIVLVAMRASDTASRRIYGMLERSACGQNGFTGSLIAPKGSAQAKVISRAWQGVSGIQDELGFVEAQAVGNRIGDAIEMQALNAVAEEFGRAANQPIKLTSIKRMFGHLEGAAGCASLISAFAQLECKQCLAAPPQAIEGEAIRYRFVAPARAGDSFSDISGGVTKAGVSAFGMSGLNVHVVVSAAPETKPASAALDHFAALVVSAPNESACRDQAIVLARFLRDTNGLDLATLSASLITGRPLYPYRIVIPFGREDKVGWVADRLVEQANSKLSRSTNPDRVLIRLVREASVAISSDLLAAFGFWARLAAVPVTFDGLTLDEMESAGLSSSRFSDDAYCSDDESNAEVIELDDQNLSAFVGRFLEVAKVSPDGLRRYAPERPLGLPFFQFSPSVHLNPAHRSEHLSAPPCGTGRVPSPSSEALHADFLAMIARLHPKPELISDGVAIDALGLDSLAIVQLVQEIEDRYGIAVRFSDYDELQSIGDLVRIVNRKLLVREMRIDQRNQSSTDVVEIVL